MLANQPQAIIIALLDPTADKQKQQASLAEAALLLDTYGAQVFKVLTQNISHQTSGTFIGVGKVEAVKELVNISGIDIVVINHHLKAGQLYALKQAICPDNECDIWDRPQLILQIFQKHAHTAEAKLQIQLALLQHHGPELSGLGLTMSQQGGGIGTRGLGETNTEVMRRHWKNEIRSVESKLAKVKQNRQQQMAHRKSSHTPTVSIIGYTNAGKTSLFNALGNKQDKVENALFATLDSSVSSLYLPGLGYPIFISDTIGFIQDLPTQLIDAFRSTLMETINADILLQVVDISDPNHQLKIQAVNQILAELSVDITPQIYVFNKADLISADQQQGFSESFKPQSPLFISAKNHQGLAGLITLIETKLLKLGFKRAAHLDYLE